MRLHRELMKYWCIHEMGTAFGMAAAAAAASVVLMLMMFLEYFMCTKIGRLFDYDDGKWQMKISLNVAGRLCWTNRSQLWSFSHSQLREKEQQPTDRPTNRVDMMSFHSLVISIAFSLCTQDCYALLCLCSVCVHLDLDAKGVLVE